MIKKKIRISTQGLDTTLHIKVNQAFAYNQDSWMDYTEDIKLSIPEIYDTNRMWVIARTHAHIFKQPRYLDYLDMTTFCGPNKKVMFPHHTIFVNQDGETAMEFSSIWLCLDKSTRRPILSEEIYSHFLQENLPTSISSPAKIFYDENEEFSLLYSHKIEYTDLDLNGHLNNVGYIKFFENAHDKNFFDEFYISDFEINYNEEVKNDEIVSIFSNKKSPEILLLKVGDIVKTVAQITYTKK